MRGLERTLEGGPWSTDQEEREGGGMAGKRVSSKWDSMLFFFFFEKHGLSVTESRWSEGVVKVFVAKCYIPQFQLADTSVYSVPKLSCGAF